jgi:hypothetical protein
LTPRYPLRRRLDGPQSRSGSFEEELSFSYRKLNNSNVFYLSLFVVLFGLGTGSPFGEKTNMCALVNEELWAVFRLSSEITVIEKRTYVGVLELIIHI